MSTVATETTAHKSANGKPANDNPSVEAALELAAKGIPVFPCLPKDKRPATRNGFKDRTMNAELIRAWWSENPDYNIGIVPADQKLTVVDLDGERGLQSWETDYAWELDGPTRTIQTPSGGLHLYFEGTMRPTASRLGPGIDTRSEDSYVLVPPSVVQYPDGTVGAYTVKDSAPPLPLPDCVTEASSKVKAERKQAPQGVEADNPYNEAQAIEYLRQRAAVAVEGSRNHTAYQEACKVREYGMSQDKCLKLMLEHWNGRGDPLEEDELVEIVEHAYRPGYAQNEFGCRAVPAEVVQGWIEEAHKLRDHGNAGVGDKPDAEAVKDEDGFDDVLPSASRNMPKPQFWDHAKMLPKVPGGSIVILYGEFGSHKTNTALSMVLDAVLEKGAKVSFAAGEGAYGLLAQRIPAHCKARGIEPEELDPVFRVVPRVPLFANHQEVARFIEKRKALRPNIVVLDTFATAIAGVDENSSQAAQYLTGNGPAGRIRREFDALVILPAHSGKDRSKGIRGNSGFGGNADVILAIEADKDAGLIKLTCEKMRDGEDRHSIYFSYEKGVVPVPVQISREEYEQRKGATPKVDPDYGKLSTVRGYLAEAKALTFGTGLTDRQIAELMAGREPEHGTKEHDHWRATVKRQRTTLRSARRKGTAWTRGLWAEDVPDGGDAYQIRWFLPVGEATIH